MFENSNYKTNFQPFSSIEELGIPLCTFLNRKDQQVFKIPPKRADSKQVDYNLEMEWHHNQRSPNSSMPSQ